MNVPEKYNLLLAGGRAGGKALCRDTDIPVPSGWKKLSDIVVGDNVFDEHGKVCTVTGVFDSIPDVCYRLYFNDKTTLDACSEHQWVTYTHANRKRLLRDDKSPRKGFPVDWADKPTVTTQQIVDTVVFGKRGDNNHCIFACDPLDCPDVELPIDPYLLGVWLGDGSSLSGQITTMDDEIVEAFLNEGFTMETKSYLDRGKAKTYIVGPLLFGKSRTGIPKGQSAGAWRQSLSELGVISNKHVPDVYLRASADQRMSLLQGLMDTDGTADITGKGVTFDNTNRQLADSVLELARSLGEKPVLSTNRAMLYGKDCGEVYSVQWKPKRQCFQLTRKIERVKLAEYRHRMIISAQRIPSKPMRCLTVDSPNHMYLAGRAMIPTHNSTLILFLLLRHIHMYASLAHALYVRESYQAIQQLEDKFELLCLQIYGHNTKIHNKTEHLFRFPNGGKVQFGQLADQKDYTKYQGADFTMLIVDEFGEIANTKFVNLLMSNLRGPKELPIRTVWAANPGGAQHGYLHSKFIAKSIPWRPFEAEGAEWVFCPSTLRDNPHIDQVQYEKLLRSGCANDAALAKAWIEGDWNIARGAYFAEALDADIHKVSNTQFPVQKLSSGWTPYIAMDWGSSAPCITYLMIESPGVAGFPKGSLIAVDELALHDPNDLSVGLKWPPIKLAEAIKEMCAKWGAPPEGVGDDAYGLQETLLETLSEHGVYMIRPTKERVAGWQEMRNMLHASKEQNGLPGLWISERCKYFWETAPFIQRDPKRPEDILTTGNDHGLDALRYGLLHRGHGAFSTGVTGQY